MPLQTQVMSDPQRNSLIRIDYRFPTTGSKVKKEKVKKGKENRKVINSRKIFKEEKQETKSKTLKKQSKTSNQIAKKDKAKKTIKVSKSTPILEASHNKFAE